MAKAAAVRVRSLRHLFGRTVALDGVSFDVPRGGLIGVVGPNGSGKTTLMRCLAGLLRPAGGKVLLDGGPPRKVVRRRPVHIGYMPQEGGIYPELPVHANVAFFARLAGVRDVRAATQEAMAFVGLERDARRRARELSGGMVRRLSLACAMVARPPLLLLDEPTAGVDPVLRASLWKDLRGLAEDGATVLVSTHDTGEARRCDAVLLLRGGRVLTYAVPERILHDTKTDDLEDAFVALVEGAP